MALIKWLFTFTLLLNSTLSLAMNEQALSGAGAKQIQTFLIANLKWHTFKSFDNKDIVYATLSTPGARGTIVMSPGRSESIITSSEIIYDIANAGYSVAIIDHRGQGFSSRLTHTDAGHVGKFFDYTKDFARFVAQKNVMDLPRPQHLLAWSMGAAVASDYIFRRPNRFKSAGFSAPFFALNTGTFGNSMVQAVADAATFGGYSDFYVPTMTAYNFNQQFDSRGQTSSLVRFNRDLQLTRRNKRIAVGGPTFNWVKEAVAATASVRARASQFPLPLLIMQPGEERIVSKSAQVTFCQSAPRCELHPVPGAAHSLFHERDQFRNRAFLDLLFFFEKNQ